MTTGVIYVLHGRRGKIPKANIALLQSFMAKSDRPATIGFLEGKEQTLEQGVQALQTQVDDLIVAPVLLFSATHVRWDLPKRIAAVISSDVHLTFLKPIGTTEAIYQYLADQLATAVSEHPGRKVLLVAHGTPHFSEPYRLLKEIAARLETQLGVPVLPANHIGHHQIEEVLANESAPLIVQRFFLTDGRLANRIKTRVEKCQPDSLFLPTLEDEPVITDALAERLRTINTPSF